jgi:hypothetical protein
VIYVCRITIVVQVYYGGTGGAQDYSDPGLVQRYRCTGVVLRNRGAGVVQGYRVTIIVHVCMGRGMLQGYNWYRSITGVQCAQE